MATPVVAATLHLRGSVCAFPDAASNVVFGFVSTAAEPVVADSLVPSSPDEFSYTVELVTDEGRPSGQSK